MKNTSLGICPAANLLFLTVEGSPCQKRLAVLLGMLKPGHQQFMAIQLMNSIYLGLPPMRMPEGMAAVYDLGWEMLHDFCEEMEDEDPLVRTIHDKWLSYSKSFTRKEEAV